MIASHIIHCRFTVKLWICFCENISWYQRRNHNRNAKFPTPSKKQFIMCNTTVTTTNNKAEQTQMIFCWRTFAIITPFLYEPWQTRQVLEQKKEWSFMGHILLSIVIVFIRLLCTFANKWKHCFYSLSLYFFFNVVVCWIKLHECSKKTIATQNFPRKTLVKITFFLIILFSRVALNEANGIVCICKEKKNKWETERHFDLLSDPFHSFQLSWARIFSIQRGSQLNDRKEYRDENNFLAHLVQKRASHMYFYLNGVSAFLMVKITYAWNSPLSLQTSM